MSRVFVVQEPQHRSGERVMDLSPAARFGDMIFLAPAGTFTRDWSGIIAKMRVLLEDFSDDDYLLPTGHPIAIGVAAALAAAANEGRIRFLRWHPRLSDYERADVSIWEGLDTSRAPVLGSPTS